MVEITRKNFETMIKSLDEGKDPGLYFSSPVEPHILLYTYFNEDLYEENKEDPMLVIDKSNRMSLVNYLKELNENFSLVNSDEIVVSDITSSFDNSESISKSKLYSYFYIYILMREEEDQYLINIILKELMEDNIVSFDLGNNRNISLFLKEGQYYIGYYDRDNDLKYCKNVGNLIKGLFSIFIFMNLFGIYDNSDNTDEFLNNGNVLSKIVDIMLSDIN